MAEPSDRFDPEHLQQFLREIERDREQQLAALRAEAAAENERLRRDACRESIEFHRQQAAAARERLRLERERTLARTRSELRRRRWALLFELQAQARARLEALFAQAWEADESQRQWCRYWLDVALREAPTAALEVRLGAGARADTVRSLQRVLDALPTPGRVHVDTGQAAGIVVSWEDRVLDARLCSHVSDLMASVVAELAALVHEPPPESA